MRTPEDAPTDTDKLIRFGRIAGADLGAARVTIELEDGVTTAPIRWVEGATGRRRTWTPPVQGEQVVLLCPGGEIGGAVALRGVTCDAFPPAGADAIDVLADWPDGARITYDPDAHAMAITLPAGATLAVTAPGGATLTGDMHVTGTITAETDVIAAGISLKNHKQTGVQPGSGLSGGPQ